MPAHDEQRGRAVLRRARVLLWIQLAAGIAAVAANAGLLWIAGQAARFTAWWSAAGPVVVVGAAVALLLYLASAKRPRRWVSVAVLLLPAVFDVGGSLLSEAVPGGAAQGEFSWFAYTSAPAVMLRYLLPLMNAALLATMAGNLIAAANAVHLLLPSSRPAFSTASGDTPPPA